MATAFAQKSRGRDDGCAHSGHAGGGGFQDALGDVGNILAGRELAYDAVERRVGADDEAEHAEDDDDDVLYQHTDAFGVADVVPVGAALDERRERQSQGRQTQSSEQRDEQVQFRNCRGQTESDKNDDSPQRVLPDDAVFAAQQADADVLVPQDVDGHVAGEPVRDEDREGQQTLDNAAERLRRQVERDAPGGLVSVLQVSEQPHADIKHDDGHHGPVQHPELAHEALRRLHLVLQRQDHSNRFQREQDCPEEERELCDLAGRHLALHRGHLAEDVVQDDAEAHYRHGVRYGRKRRQVLEVPHPVDQDQGQEHPQHHLEHRHFHPEVFQHRLKVLSHEYYVHTTCANLVY